MRSTSAPAARRKSRAGIAQVLQKHGGARGAANRLQSDPAAYEAAQRRQWCEVQLRSIYGANEPAKVANAAGLCAKYAGKERALVRKVQAKYEGAGADGDLRG